MAKKQPGNELARLPVPIEIIERRIYLVRGQKVILDSDLADLYQVRTKRLNEAVKRNSTRFPADFMFQLTKEENDFLKAANLRSQIATSNYAGRRYRPYVFTELGVAMLSSVLNSERAVQMNIIVMRAFVKLRELMATHKDLARKIEELERQQQEYGHQLAAIYSVVMRLMAAPRKPKRKFGFRAE